MVSPVNVRAGRATAFFAGFQSAQGTLVSDFTAAGSKRLWTEDAAIWLPADVWNERFMDADFGPKDDSILAGTVYDMPQGSVAVKGTPTSMEWLLKSNYGAYSAGAFTLATGIASDRWLTLGWVEDRFTALSAAGRLVRLRDAWFHRLVLEWSGAGKKKYLLIRGDYAGRTYVSQLQNAGGITLPAAPMTVSDKDHFPTQNTTLKDSNPAIEYRFRDLKITFDQGLGRDWDMGADLYDIYKLGPLMASIEFTAEFSDNPWTYPIGRNVSATPSTMVITSTCEDGTVLTITLYGVVFKIDPCGHDGQTYREFRARGMASRVGTNFVTVAMA